MNLVEKGFHLFDFKEKLPLVNVQNVQYFEIVTHFLRKF